MFFRIAHFRSICQHQFLLALTALLCLTFPADAIDSRMDLGSYVFQSWKLQQGLPQDAAIAIAQTNEGYLWIGTQEGLARFDGLHFTNFKPQNTPQLPHKSINTLLTDPVGRLWVGTLNGLAMYENGKWKDMTPLLPDPNVFVSAMDRNHCVWIGTNGGLTRYCAESSYRSFSTKEGLLNNQIRSITFDDSNNMIVGTSAGLFFFKDEHFYDYPDDGYFKNLRISALLFHHRSLYIGTGDKGLYSIQDHKISRVAEDTFKNRPITCIVKDDHSNIWVGSHLGLFRLNDQGISAFPTTHILSKSFIRVIFQDRDKSLWIGSHYDGLNRLRDGMLRTLTKDADGLAGEVVYSAIQDRQSNIWVGTESGVSILDPAFQVLNTIHLPSVISIAEGHENEMWFGTYRDGLIQYRNGSMKQYTTEAGMPTNQVRSVLPLANGTVWIGTGAGLAILENGMVHIQSNIPRVPVNSMLRDSHNRIWLATTGRGIFVFENGKFRQITPRDGLSSQNIFAFSEISGGYILIGTNGDGLFVSDGHVFYRIGPEFGFSQDTVSGIVPDTYGRIWFGGTGIFHTERKTLVDIFINHSGYLNTIVYGTDEGMRSLDCSAGNHPIACRTQSGHILFATTKGLTIADPSNIKTKQAGPDNLLIERIIVDGAELAVRDPLVVRPGSKRIEFQYTALTFVSPESVNFKYKLEPFDHEWIDSNTRRTVSFTNLRPGDYTFSLLASKNGALSEKPLAIHLQMLPFFYQRKEFYVLLAILIAGITFAVHRLRVRGMITRNQQLQQIVTSRTEALEEVIKSGAILTERNRIAQELHDTVAQGLSAITVQLRVALKQNQSESAQAILQNALNLARQSLHETRAAILSIHPSSLTRSGIAAAVNELARGYTAGSGMEFSLALNGKAFPLPDEAELNLLRICQEAISNSVRHSKGQNLWISLNYTSDSLEVQIQDDGRGIPEARKTKDSSFGSLGLMGMKERAARIKAHLVIDSPNGIGTRVSCKIDISEMPG